MKTANIWASDSTAFVHKVWYHHSMHTTSGGTLCTTLAYYYE